MLASSNGHLSVAEFLIGAKADVNAIYVSKKKSDFPDYISEFRNQFFIRNRLRLLTGSCVFHVLRSCAHLHSALGLGVKFDLHCWR